MLGNLYQVPDKWWGFESHGRENHPGACVNMVSAHKVNMLKGTDPRSRDYKLVHVEVDPDGSNRLLKRTAFAIKPHPKSLRKIQLLHDERYIGELSDAHIQQMQGALEKYFVDGGA